MHYVVRQLPYTHYHQSGLIIRFLIQHTGKVSINFVHIRPILDVFLQMMEHIRHLDICPSMNGSINISTDAGAQIASDLGKGVIQGVSGYVAKKMRTVKVTLKAGHRLLLHSPEQ